MRKLLAVYNICGISGRENVAWYERCIDNLLAQSLDNYDVAISSCLSADSVIDRLLARYKGKVFFNIIDERHTVNVTFNRTVQVCNENIGPYGAYLYVDSGVDCGTDRGLFDVLFSKFSGGEYGMLTLQTDNDTGFPEWFGIHGPILGEDFPVPLGRTCNLHCQAFSHKIYKQFDDKILPDIFVAYCSESVLSFFNAVLGLKWDILANTVLEHNKGVDGATSGYDHLGPRRCGWDNLFEGRSVLEFVNDPYFKRVGGGYEEMQGVMFHDASAYHPDGSSKYPDEMTSFMKKYFFMSQLDYSTIPSCFIDKKDVRVAYGPTL